MFLINLYKRRGPQIMSGSSLNCVKVVASKTNRSTLSKTIPTVYTFPFKIKNFNETNYKNSTFLSQNRTDVQLKLCSLHYVSVPLCYLFNHINDSKFDNQNSDLHHTDINQLI